METWPSTLPAWQWGVSLSVDGVLRSKRDGFQSQRNEFDRRNDVMTLKLLLTDAQFQLFETFVQDDLHQGSARFKGPVYDGAGYRLETIQIVGGNYSAVDDGSFFTVSSQIQIFNRHDPDKLLVKAIIDLNHPVSNLEAELSRLSEVVNFNFL